MIWGVPRILLVECLQVSLSLCGFSSPTFVMLFCLVTADPPSPDFPIGERGSLHQSAQSSAFLYTDCPDLGEVEVVVFWGLSIDDSGEDEDDDPPHPDYSGGVRGGVW